jgi:hypothetical protein
MVVGVETVDCDLISSNIVLDRISAGCVWLKSTTLHPYAAYIRVQVPVGCDVVVKHFYVERCNTVPYAGTVFIGYTWGNKVQSTMVLCKTLLYFYTVKREWFKEENRRLPGSARSRSTLTVFYYR